MVKVHKRNMGIFCSGLPTAFISTYSIEETVRVSPCKGFSQAATHLALFRTIPVESAL